MILVNILESTKIWWDYVCDVNVACTGNDQTWTWVMKTPTPKTQHLKHKSVHFPKQRETKSIWIFFINCGSLGTFLNSLF